MLGRASRRILIYRPWTIRQRLTRSGLCLDLLEQPVAEADGNGHRGHQRREMVVDPGCLQVVAADGAPGGQVVVDQALQRGLWTPCCIPRAQTSKERAGDALRLRQKERCTGGSGEPATCSLEEYERVGGAAAKHFGDTIWRQRLPPVQMQGRILHERQRRGGSAGAIRVRRALPAPSAGPAVDPARR